MVIVTESKKFQIGAHDKDARAFDNLRHYLSMLNHTNVWTVTIKKEKKKRTLKQNAYLHELISYMVEFQEGYKTDNLITQAKRKYAYECAIFDEFTDEASGAKLLFPKRTSDMNTTECGLVIDRLLEDLLMAGVKVPTQKEFEKMYGYD